MGVSVHQRPLFSFSDYHLASQVEELHAASFCTIDLLLLVPMIEIWFTNKLVFSVALAYFDFEAGDLYQILHLEKNLTVSFLNASAAWMAPRSLTWVGCLSMRSIYVSSESFCRFGTRAWWRFGTRPTPDKATLINHVGVTNVARQR